jgi:hypothetical protein
LPIRCTKHVYAPPEADDGCRVIIIPPTSTLTVRSCYEAIDHFGIREQ